MYNTLAVTLTIICYTTSIPTIQTGHRERREARWVWTALDELRTLIPDLTDNIEQRLEANEGPGAFYDDRNYPLRDLYSMLRVLSPSTVEEVSLGDHKHHMQARSANSELTAALDSMEELAEVEEAGDVVIGLTLAVSGMERANNALEEGKREQEALRMIEKVEKTLIIISQGRERVRRSTDCDQGHAGYNEGVKNKVHNENKVYRSNFTPAQFDWLLDQFDLSRDEVDDLQLLSGDKFDEMLARVEIEAASSKSSNIWEFLELLRDPPRNILPNEVEAPAYGTLGGVTSHILERLRQRVEPSAQEVRYKLLPQIVDSVPKDVWELADQGGKIVVRNAKLVADYTGPKLAHLYDSIDRLQAQMRQSAGETVEEVGPALQSLAEEFSQTIFETAAQTLLGLMDHVPSQGLPFPSIQGPSPRDRVCIVGAGPAGIHMALSLKRRNFSNVEIFEKSNRVGGKSFDIQFDGINHPQGTIFMEPNYFDNIIPLAREFGGEVVQLVPETVWRTNNKEGGGSLLQYILSEVAQLTNSSSPEKNFALVLKTTLKYVSLHKQLFGSYEGDMMLRPSPSTLYRVRGTSLEFLTREGLLPLVPLFTLSQSFQGYGQLDEISAVYTLIWNNPKLIVGLALRVLGRDKEPLGIFILKDGFEAIWKTIVKKENIKVHYNIEIESIKRNGHNVELGIWKNAVIKREVCDWAIWTPSMIEFLKTSFDITSQEFSLMGSLTPSIFTASFVRMTNMDSPLNYYIETMDDKVEHGVTAAVSYEGLLDLEGLEAFAKNSNKSRVFYVLQIGSNYTDESDLNNILRNHFEKRFQVKDLEILNTISWPYFPRWSPRDMASGRPWDVFENLQGKNRMWFAGSSVSFESIRGVMEYNNLLLRHSEERPEQRFYYDIEPSIQLSKKEAFLI